MISVDSFNRYVQNMYQTLESSRSASIIASKTLKNIGFDTFDCMNPTTIARSAFQSISSNDHLHHPPLYFPLTCCRSEPPWDALCDASVSSSSPSCHSPLAMIQLSPSRLPCSDLNIIELWWLHLNQYTTKVIDFYLRTNLNFLIIFFILMPPSNSIDLTSSSSSRALES